MKTLWCPYKAYTALPDSKPLAPTKPIPRAYQIDGIDGTASQGIDCGLLGLSGFRVYLNLPTYFSVGPLYIYIYIYIYPILGFIKKNLQKT